MTITEFILARIAEKEAGASAHHRVLCMRTACDADDCVWGADEQEEMERQRVCTCGYPARVLAECEAMRKVVAICFDEHEMDDHPNALLVRGRVLPSLASVYAEHPDYRAEWRV